MEQLFWTKWDFHILIQPIGFRWLSNIKEFKLINVGNCLRVNFISIEVGLNLRFCLKQINNLTIDQTLIWAKPNKAVGWTGYRIPHIPGTTRPMLKQATLSQDSFTSSYFINNQKIPSWNLSFPEPYWWWKRKNTKSNSFTPILHKSYKLKLHAFLLANWVWMTCFCRLWKGTWPGHDKYGMMMGTCSSRGGQIWVLQHTMNGLWRWFEFAP